MIKCSCGFEANDKRNFPKLLVKNPYRDYVVFLCPKCKKEI